MSMRQSIRLVVFAQRRVLLAGAEIELGMMGTNVKLLTKSLNKQQMQNCNSSAGTAAQQSLKCPLLFRQAALAAILLLAAVYSHGQCDTTKRGFLLAEIKGKVQFIGACRVKCNNSIYYIDPFTKIRLKKIKPLSFSDGSK